jgi:hypothetical protein
MLRGTERSSLSANTEDSKPSNHFARAPKCKLDELLKSFDETTPSQRQDGLIQIEDNKLKHILMMKVALTCTDGFPDSLLKAFVKEMCKYSPWLYGKFLLSKLHFRNT